MKIKQLSQSIAFAALLGLLLMLSVHVSLQARDNDSPGHSPRTLNATIPATTTLQPIKDNSIFEANTNSGGASPILLAGKTDHAGVRRALFAFDLSSIPDGAVINSVSLELTVLTVKDRTPATFTLHRVSKDWGEAGSSSTKGQGAPAQSGDATWEHALYSTTTWITAGGDFVSTASATSTVGATGVYTWTSGQMISDVYAWRSEPTANFGWLLMADESVDETIKQIASKENSEVSKRPRLIVSYQYEQVAKTVYLPLVQRSE